MTHYTSSNEEETKAWAKTLIQGLLEVLAVKPIVVTLEGEMGAGKTQVAKGIATALGITRIVSSPTYVLTREYEGSKGRLVHIDCWRVPQIAPQELEIDSYLVPGTVTVIEWPEPLLGYLKSLGDHVELVSLKIEDADEGRIITTL